LDVLLRPKASKARFFQPWQPRWVRLEPGIWQVHADAGQAVGRGPGATAAGVAAHTEVHLGSRTSPADLGIGGCLRLTNVVQHGEKLGFGWFWELKIRHFTMITICDE